MPRRNSHAHQVAKYKREEKRLIAWLVGAAGKAASHHLDQQDDDGAQAPRHPRDLSPGQLYECFVRVVRDLEEEAQGDSSPGRRGRSMSFAAPPLEVLQAGWAALGGREDCDRRMRARLRRLSSISQQIAAENKGRRHRKHTDRLCQVVKSLEKTTLKTRGKRTAKTKTKTGTSMQTRAAAAAVARDVPAQPFLQLKSSTRCP